MHQNNIKIILLFITLFGNQLFGSYCAFFNATKHNEFNFLSNFYEKEIRSDLGIFKCSEGVYQYQKFAHLQDSKLHELFKNADGETAYILSRKFQNLTAQDWEAKKIQAMRAALAYKFADKQLQKQLLDTQDAYLVENSPSGHDSFWADNGDGSGQNMLGILLMELRHALGGHGIVELPNILKEFYATKCTECNNACHFTNAHMIYNRCCNHLGDKLTLGNVSTFIKPSNIPDGTGRFLYFNLNEMPEFIEEGARLISQRIKELGLKNPFFVTPEASTISLAHILRTKYNIDGIVLAKRKKPNDIDTISEDYCAITSLEAKKLYLDKSISLAGKDIIIIDNVCTTGETLKAVCKLLYKAGVAHTKIHEAIVLFSEGLKKTHVEITEDIHLPIHTFAHIPFLPFDPSVDNALFKLFSACDLPTEYGTLKFCVFKHRSLNTEAIACISPLTFLNGKDNISVRIHDACITSETFHSVKCDCRLQLDKALKYIAEFGGMVIYLNQEGRGIGLANKIAAYNIQETLFLDTVDANRKLGLPDDMREYIAARDIIQHFGIESVMLMTNNKRKEESLTTLGIKVAGRIPCIVKPQSKQMEKYMHDKTERMGHLIPQDTFTA